MMVFFGEHTFEERNSRGCEEVVSVTASLLALRSLSCPARGVPGPSLMHSTSEWTLMVAEEWWLRRIPIPTEEPGRYPAGRKPSLGGVRAVRSMALVWSMSGHEGGDEGLWRT